MAPESMVLMWYLDISQQWGVAAKQQICSQFCLILSLVETHYNKYHEDQSLNEKENRCPRKVYVNYFK